MWAKRQKSPVIMIDSGGQAVIPDMLMRKRSLQLISKDLPVNAGHHSAIPSCTAIVRHALASFI